jgi:predicted Fe-S protein YdhL (DUF1289 family)
MTTFEKEQLTRWNSFGDEKRGAILKSCEIALKRPVSPFKSMHWMDSAGHIAEALVSGEMLLSEVA